MSLANGDRDSEENGYGDYEAALTSSIVRASLYSKLQNSDRFVFENPLYSATASATSIVDEASVGTQMRLKDFLASIPSFSEFTDHQLLTLEQKATIGRFESGDVIFKQGDKGENFYVIHEGVIFFSL